MKTLIKLLLILAFSSCSPRMYPAYVNTYSEKQKQEIKKGEHRRMLFTIVVPTVLIATILVPRNNPFTGEVKGVNTDKNR